MMTRGRSPCSPPTNPRPQGELESADEPPAGPGQVSLGDGRTFMSDRLADLLPLVRAWRVRSADNLWDVVTYWQSLSTKQKR